MTSAGLLRLLFLLVLVATFAGRAAPPSPGYELLFADEFDGNLVNKQDWSFRTGLRTGTGINGLNLAANVALSDGHLVITAKQETVNGKIENTGGGLISKHRFG
jgi:beta-glucanase (GH16 family)